MPQRTSNRQYPVVIYTVRLHRRPSFYVYSIGLPNFLLVTLGFLALRLHKEDDHMESDRVQIVLTLLLTTIGYRTIVGDLLPHTSTLSWLELYLLICIGVLFGLALFSYGVFGPCTIDTQHNALTTLFVPAVVIVTAAFALRDLCQHHGITGRMADAVIYALCLGSAVYLPLTRMGVGELHMMTDTPAELIFFLWILCNGGVLLAYVTGALQPPVNSKPLDAEGTLDELRPLPVVGNASAVLDSGSPTRPSTSPPRRVRS